MEIDELVRNLGPDALRHEAEVMGLSPKGNRIRCPFPGCVDKGADRERDAQLYGGNHPRIFCFACSTGGDVVDLVQLGRGLTRHEAILALTGGTAPPARPQLHVVGRPPPAEDPDKLAPTDVRRIWDALEQHDTQGEDYLRGRGLEEALELGMVRFATEQHPTGGVKAQARRGYRVAVLMTDVVGNPRGIQTRLVREPHGREPKILSVKGSATTRAFFGEPDRIEASPIVAVAEGLADTLALSAWARGRTEVAVVGAAGKGALPRLADELRDAGIQLEGKYFALFPQNDRPKNGSRMEFRRLGQLLKQLGAHVVMVSTHEEFKDLAEWLQARLDTEWPPPELQRAFLPEPGDDSPRDALPVMSPGLAVPIPASIQADVYRQDFTTLCALLDDAVTREAVMGRGELTWCEMSWFARVGGRRLEEVDLSTIRLGLEAQGRSTDGKPLKFTEQEIAKALAVIARRKTVHPVRDWLVSSLRWDGKHRIETDLAALLGHEAGGFEARLLKRWTLSAIARAMVPGCKVDTVLVLVGDQGTRKSTFFDVLGGEWFTDAPVNVGDTDGMMIMREKWIVEWAELDAMRRARDQESIKAFITARIDFFRAPYLRKPSEAPRHCVIVGTTNNRQFLHDPSGNRRFWPIEVRQRIDIAWLRANREQLWAEARALHAAGEQWWLDDDEEVELRAVHVEHEVQDPWTDLVRDWLDQHRVLGEVTVAHLLLEALKHDMDQVNPAIAVRVGRVMATLGWGRARRRRDGAREWVYVRPEDGP